MSTSGSHPPSDRLGSTEPRLGRFLWWAVIAIATYAALIIAEVTVGGLPAGRLAPFVAWMSVPAGAGAFVVVLILVRTRAVQGLRRVAWLLVLSSVAVDLIVTAAWTQIDPAAAPIYGLIADCAYQIYYPLMGAACACFLVTCGGSFRRIQIWLDATTVTLAVAAVLWILLFEAPLAPPAGYPLSLPTKLAYTAEISLAATMALLLFAHLQASGRNLSLRLLVLAMIVGLASDMTWLASRSGGSASLEAAYALGDTLFGIADIVYCAFIAAAAASEYQDAPGRLAKEAARIQSYSFLPALALLLAIALLVGSEATHRGLDTGIVIGMVLAGAILLVVRQRGVGNDLRRLTRELATREAESRLTELVRSSADVIAIVDAQGGIAFVSPSAEHMLGRPPAALLRTPAARLLGAAAEPVVAALLERLKQSASGSIEAEVAIADASAAARVIRVVGTNKIDNPMIEGIALTLSDVSEQRALEREIVELATMERQRLSRDIHEGLGQELTGIAMLLQAASMRSGADARAQADDLQKLVRRLNHATSTVRELAGGLSALQVVRGSLPAAIQQLALHFDSVTPIVTRIDEALAGAIVDSSLADHLYRSTQEAIGNALRHSGCTVVRVELQAKGQQLIVTITDDGCGFDFESVRRKAFGLRMIEYRSRILGGSFSVTAEPGEGTQLIVSVPFAVDAAGTE